jgi:3-methyladenine DNA glycosylase AlkC
MAEPLKNLYFTPFSIRHLADVVRAVAPDFDRERFLALVFDDQWETLELKDRMHHTARCLHATLPADYVQALAILYPVAPQIKGFDVMTFPDFVEIYGQDEWDRSMDALGYFTKFASSEFAVRPFLDRDPDRAMQWVWRWARDPDPNVRRLASEGTRPRLPWAMALPKFKQDPSLVIPILDALKDDDSEMVRRSVANNLNDISKDHPELVLELAEQWRGHSAEVDAVLKHALRGLLKAGDPRAMALFGFDHPSEVRANNLHMEPASPRIGEGFEFTFDLEVGGEGETRVRLEYRVEYVKARGERSPRTFQIGERNWKHGLHKVRKRHSLVNMSTRTHYPGRHTLTVIVNGHAQVGVEFEVLPG